MSERVPWRLAMRDAAYVSITILLWQGEIVLRGADTPLAWAAAVAASSFVAVAGFLAHEWGHLVGARLSGAVVHFPERVSSLFLFNFDSDRNSRRQFLAMSMGGFLATALVVAAYVGSLPRDALSGRVALLLTGSGVLATMVLELPPAWRVLRGAPIPTGSVYRSETTDSVPGRKG